MRSLPESKVFRAVAIACAFLFWMPLAVLMVFYVFVGDRTVTGEFFTIWPPVLWFFALVPLALPLLALGRRRHFVVCLAGILLFLVMTEEWRPLLRWGSQAKRKSFETPHSNQNGQDGTALRVISWNVSGADRREILKILEAYKPDVCFLQETPDGNASIQDADLTGYWRRFHWLDAGDCGVLSRYPVRPLKSRKIGPWSDPQMLAMRLPDNRETLLINVRLMLPALLANPFSPQSRRRFVESHHERISQYAALWDLIAEKKMAPVILAGDFNTPACAKSLSPLRQVLRDAWRVCGHGWGRTATADFPVSRIDQCWISEKVECTDGRVFRESLSDHRLLLVDLVLNP